MRSLCIALACLLSVPAVAHDKLDAMLAEWEGLPADFLVEVWGYGRAGEAPNGNRTYTYSASSAGPTFSAGPFASTQVTSDCSVSFEIEAGIILDSYVDAGKKREERLCWREFKDNEAPDID